MKEAMTFEQALTELEEIVARLDDETLPLEQSIQLFSQGARLVDFCNKTLKTAQIKIDELLPAAKEEE